MSELNAAQPFTVAAAHAAGITARNLRSSRFKRIYKGVYIAASVTLNLEIRARAALLIHPQSAFLTHSTSAALLRFPVPDDPEIHVTVPSPQLRRRRPGIQCHVRRGRPALNMNGMPVSGGGDMYCELANTVDLVDLVVLGDAMSRREQPSQAALIQAARAWEGRGSVRARRGAALVDSRAESPMETRVRLLLLFAGFPAPEVNLTLRGTVATYRPDLCWPDLRLVVEYDGQHHRNDLNQWDHDIRRREWFQAQGWTIITLVARDVFQRPAETVQRVYDAWLASGGQPFSLREDWRPHFPGLRAA